MPAWNKGKFKLCQGISHSKRLGTVAIVSIFRSHLKAEVEKELGLPGTFEPSQRSEKLETQDHAVDPAGQAG